MQKEKACVCARLTQTRNEQRTCAEMEREMLKYGVYAKGVELLCFKHALGKLSTIFPEMVTAVFDSPFMIKAHKNKKCILFTDKVQDQKVKESIASQNSKYELDWKFHYEKGVDEFYNTYTECGICKLGKRENCFEFVLCLCNMDERNYRNMGGELHRTKTLGQGDECCNFHVTKIR